MHVTGKYALKKPAEAPMETLLFATPEGNLLADDPKQNKLDLKTTEETAPKELKIVHNNAAKTA
jgi:hypothetical protein